MRRFKSAEKEDDCVTLATCVALLCDKSLADVHTQIQDEAGSCSMESSFSGGANDENQHPESHADRPISLDSAREPGAPASTPTKPLTLLQQLHALQTYSACLYTQDMVSEVFIHNIIDHVRYGSASWAQPARNAAMCGLCDMTKFCGKRLETLGSLKKAMPDFYAHLELLASRADTPGQVKEAIMETLTLRENKWEAPKEPTAEAQAATPQATATEPDRFGFAEMLGASGVAVASCDPVASCSATVGFPITATPDHVVKADDMLAAVQAIDI